ncbi:MAG: hypothetical protein AAGA03_19345, partial [Planctomycetota bacterium]
FAPLSVPEDVIEFLARTITRNIRELVGGLNKLIAYAQLTGQEVSLQLAEEQLTDILSANRRRITIDEIQRTVCQFYRIDRSEMSPLPPICTALTKGRKRNDQALRVVIESQLSEIGTVGLYCADLDSNKRWKLEFDIRSTLETDREAHGGSGESAGIVDEATIELCRTTIARVFGSATVDSLKPNQLIKSLQGHLDQDRKRWPPSLLRELWQSLFDLEPGRRKSPQHEARWINLTGFCLRPGYGVAVDDWRVAQMWKQLHGKLAFPASQSQTEAFILWRRIAGGLTAGQQSQLAAPLLSLVRGKAGRLEPHQASEVWRLIGSLESMATIDKLDAGEIAIRQLGQKKSEKLWTVLSWALGRIGSRQPVYGPLNTTVPPGTAAVWCERLMNADRYGPETRLALLQMARKTGDRFRDLPTETRNEVRDFLRSVDTDWPTTERLLAGESFGRSDQAGIFGDSLPLGIRLVR